MMLLLGTFLGTTTREREWEGRRWNETTAHILDGVRSVDVTLSNGDRNGLGAFDQSTLPAKGDPIALDVYGRGGGNKRVYYTATSVVSDEQVAETLGLLGV